MSLINKIFNTLGFGNKEDEELEEMFRYPMVDKGIPYKSIDVLLKSQTELIADIRIQSGVEDEVWEKMCLPTIRNYAAFVHLLPASENHHHRGFGGLFRHGLEVAYWSLLKQEAVVLGERDLTPSEKHARVNDWRLAAFVAGLCHDLGKPMIDIAVSTPVGEWSPHSKFLVDFLKENKVSRYHVTWRPNRGKNEHEAFAPMAIRSVVDPALWEYFCRDYRHIKSDIPNEILKAISGKVDEENTLADIVKKADQASVARDLLQYDKNSAMATFNATKSFPFDWFILNMINDLILDEDIDVNKPGAYIWSLHNLVGEHVVALNWSKAYDEIKRRLPDVVAQSIPSDKDRTAEILIERNAAMPGDRGGLYARLRPQAISDQAKKGLSFLLFDPDVIYSSRINYNPMPCVELEDDEEVVAKEVTQEDADHNKGQEDAKAAPSAQLSATTTVQVPVADHSDQIIPSKSVQNSSPASVDSKPNQTPEILDKAKKSWPDTPTLIKEKQKLKDVFDDLGLINVRRYIIDKSDYWVSVLHPQAVNVLAAAKGIKGTQIISLLSEAGAMSTPMLITKDETGRNYIKLGFMSNWFDAVTIKPSSDIDATNQPVSTPRVDAKTEKAVKSNQSAGQDKKPSNSFNHTYNLGDDQLKSMSKDQIIRLLCEELEAGILKGKIINEEEKNKVTIRRTVKKLRALGVEPNDLTQSGLFILYKGVFYRKSSN